MERYRITSDAAVYFVTYSVVDWLPVFVSESTCRIITDSLNYCHAHKRLGINAYVLMPTHMHAIVFDRDFDARRLQQTLTDSRKYTGRTLCDFFETHQPSSFAAAFRALSTEDRERRFWQPSRHPEAIETELFWRQKLDYLHENPYRKGLVRRAADWRFSSAAFYVSDGGADCDVPISTIDWS
jgi:REP element-mobilizing transposase RayT